MVTSCLDTMEAALGGKGRSVGEYFAVVVESSAVCLRAICGALDALGVGYKRNTSGAGVMEQVLAYPQRPALILLDFDLPEGDAVLIAAALRAHPQTAEIPIVLIAEEIQAAALHRVTRALFNGTLVKPIDRGALMALVIEILPNQNVALTN